MTRGNPGNTYRDALVKRLANLAGRPSLLESPRARRIATTLAVLLLISGLIVAIAARPELLQQVNPRAWVLLLACVPLTVIGNSTLLWQMARIANNRITPARAGLITILSTAANMLPVPGASAVRIAALKTTSNTYRDTSLVTFFTAICRVGTALVSAGVALYLLGFAVAASAILAAGIGATLAASFGLRITLHAPTSSVFRLVILQFIMVGIGALRLWLAFSALNQSQSVPEVLVLALAGTISSVLGIAPAGMGLAEASAAGIALLIGVPASAAFLAEALNRITSLLVITPLAVILQRLLSIDARRES